MSAMRVHNYNLIKLMSQRKHVICKAKTNLQLWNVTIPPLAHHTQHNTTLQKRSNIWDEVSCWTQHKNTYSAAVFICRIHTNYASNSLVVASNTLPAESLFLYFKKTGGSSGVETLYNERYTILILRPLVILLKSK